MIIYKNVCLSDIIAVNKSWREYLLCVIVVLSSWCFTLYTYIVYISIMNISWSYNIHYTLPFNFVFVIIMYSQEWVVKFPVLYDFRYCFQSFLAERRHFPKRRCLRMGKIDVITYKYVIKIFNNPQVLESKTGYEYEQDLIL